MSFVLKRAFEAEAAPFLADLASGEDDLDWSSIAELVVPALAVTIYFRSQVADYAGGVEACLRSFLAEWGEQLTWYADEDLGRFRPATAKRLARPLERLRRRDKAMPFYAWTMSAGETFESPSALSFQAHLRADDGEQVSFVRASFPRDGWAGAGRAGHLVDVVGRWAAQLPLVHGYAGLALNQSEPDRQIRSWILPAISGRFPGYEIDDCGGTALVGLNAIKGVNWLTLVGERFLERLGGSEALRSGLSPAIEMLPIPGRGMVFRLGAEPRAGDLLHDERLPLYRELSRALAPVRLTVHPALGPAEYGSFGSDGTAQWLRRFD